MLSWTDGIASFRFGSCQKAAARKMPRGVTVPSVGRLPVLIRTVIRSVVDNEEGGVIGAGVSGKISSSNKTRFFATTGFT